MKKIFMTIATILSFYDINYAQLYVDGAALLVNTSTTLMINGDFINTNNISGKVTNKGTIDLTGNFDNSGNYITSGTPAIVRFSGSSSTNVKTNNKIFQKVELDKAPGSNITVADKLTINNTFSFIADNNKVLLGDNNVVFGTSSLAKTLSYDANEYFVTNGTGQVIKNNLGTTAFVYPVGNDLLTYNPITLTELGAIDNKGVRCLANPLTGGTIGDPISTNAVNTSWIITESTSGGSNLDLKCKWIKGDEQTTFNRNSCAIAFHDGNSWNYGLLGAATTPNYTRTLSGVTSVGAFTILDGVPSIETVISSGENDSEIVEYVEIKNTVVLAYPNPAKDAVTFEVKLPNDAKNTFIEISDLSGKIILKLPIDTYYKTTTWHTDRHEGVYIYAYISDGKRLQSGKIVVIK